LWRPLPYPHTDRLMALATASARGRFWLVAPADFFAGATTRNRSPRSPRATRGAQPHRNR
jgi:hypothetical protein